MIEYRVDLSMMEEAMVETSQAMDDNEDDNKNGMDGVKRSHSSKSFQRTLSANSKSKNKRGSSNILKMFCSINVNDANDENDTDRTPPVSPRYIVNNCNDDDKRETSLEVLQQ